MPKYSTTVTVVMTKVIEFEAPDMAIARDIAINGKYEIEIPEGWNLLSDKADLPLTDEV